MVVGFNHNIRYKGEVFHVQTEDSGRANPHIITLLYRGGTILGSIKTSYADILMTEQLELVVESIMKEQHKDMMRRLKNGEYDARILGTAQAPAAAAEEPQAAPGATAGTGSAPAAAPAAAATTPHAATTQTAAPAAVTTQAAPVAVTTQAAPVAKAAPATAPAAPAQAAPSGAAPLPRETAAAVRQASAAALATALHRQQPTPKETPAPASGAAPASTSKRSLDEVILDYLITGEE